MSNVRWIKIVVDIFNDEKILLIESMPEADSLIVIWFKILCMAGKTNNGGVMMLNDKIAYTDEMLATIFRRPINTVRLALKTFENLGMILIINDTITIPNWSKHQSLEQLKNRTEYMREYMQKYRKEQALLALGEKPVNKKVNSKANSKLKVNTLEREEELEIELDKKIYREVIDYLNMKVDKNFTHTSKATQRLIDARTNEKYTLEDFKTVIDIKTESWKDDPKMNSYLRPNTLFGTKFEAYLNEKPIENTKTKTTEYGW